MTEVLDAFKAIDEDGDGYIRPSELIAALQDALCDDEYVLRMQSSISLTVTMAVGALTGSHRGERAAIQQGKTLDCATNLRIIHPCRCVSHHDDLRAIVTSVRRWTSLRVRCVDLLSSDP